MIITLIIICDECSHLSVETFYGIIRKTLRKVFIKEYAKDINEFIEISMLQVLVLVHVTGPHLLLDGWGCQAI